MQKDVWEDIVVWDQAALLELARENVHNAFLARKAGNFKECTTYASKALDTLNHCEEGYPKAVAALRDSLEKL
jgi:hypothetical protein